MKTLSLDIGDKWTGSAISDPTKTFSRPYKTIKTSELDKFLADVINKEAIDEIVVGYPKTLRGKISEQTKKIETEKNRLEKKFSTIKWGLWDERLTSKMATKTKKIKNKEEKLQLHSIAAAFILDSYLTYLKNIEKRKDDKS